jgi:hypothetical protein
VARAGRPLGDITRGTTAPNRLRRVDRFIAWECARALRTAADPLVVDLGFGASPVTTVELHHRLARIRPDVRVAGIEIDPARVRAASPYSQTGLSFVHGGFELPIEGDPVVVRALNVLRQYDETQVESAWERMRSRLDRSGVIVDGTCDEVGRRACWITLDADGPRSLSLSTHLGSLGRPSELAERLPKALIHRNIPGERIHDLLAALDAHWDRAASYAAFGVVQRWVQAVRGVAQDWPVLHGPNRWRLGELTVPWSAVAPRALPGQ